MQEMHFFKSIENELENSFNYIEPTEDNFKCYGAKYFSLLTSIGTEFESISKTLIQIQRPEASLDNIGLIKQNLLELFPNLCKNKIEIARINEVRYPFNGWDCGEKLVWWQAFTDLKHNRIKHYAKANLDTVLNAMCCLATLITYLAVIRDENKHLRLSGLFYHEAMGQMFTTKGAPIPDSFS